MGLDTILSLALEALGFLALVSHSSSRIWLGSWLWLLALAMALQL